MYLAMAVLAILVTRTRARVLVRGRALPAILIVGAVGTLLFWGRRARAVGPARPVRVDGDRGDFRVHGVLAAARRDLHDRAGAPALRPDRAREPSGHDRGRRCRPCDGRARSTRATCSPPPPPSSSSSPWGPRAPYRRRSSLRSEAPVSPPLSAGAPHLPPPTVPLARGRPRPARDDRRHARRLRLQERRRGGGGARAPRELLRLLHTSPWPRSPSACSSSSPGALMRVAGGEPRAGRAAAPRPARRRRGGGGRRPGRGPPLGTLDGALRPAINKVGIELLVRPRAGGAAVVRQDGDRGVRRARRAGPGVGRHPRGGGVGRGQRGDRGRGRRGLRGVGRPGAGPAALTTWTCSGPPCARARCRTERRSRPST